LGPFIVAPVNHSPARNKKTTTALHAANQNKTTPVGIYEN